MRASAFASSFNARLRMRRSPAAAQRAQQNGNVMCIDLNTEPTQRSRFSRPTIRRRQDVMDDGTRTVVNHADGSQTLVEHNDGEQTFAEHFDADPSLNDGRQEWCGPRRPPDGIGPKPDRDASLDRHPAAHAQSACPRDPWRRYRRAGLSRAPYLVVAAGKRAFARARRPTGGNAGRPTRPGDNVRRLRRRPGTQRPARTHWRRRHRRHARPDAGSSRVSSACLYSAAA